VADVQLFYKIFGKRARKGPRKAIIRLLHVIKASRVYESGSPLNIFFKKQDIFNGKYFLYIVSRKIVLIIFVKILIKNVLPLQI